MHMRFLFIFCSCFVFLQLHAQQPVKHAVDKVKLKTIEGKRFSLSGIDHTLIALVFLSPDCPLSQNYSLVLNNLQKSKSKNLKIVGIFAGEGYRDDEIVAFQQKYAIDFLLVRDKKNELVKYTRATITPEVILYDSNRTLIYRGAIDDWAVSLGKKKQQPTQFYLNDAIEKFLQHKPVSPFETNAVGCFISNK